MARKVKGKKNKVKKQELEERKKDIRTVWDLFQVERGEYETHLNAICKNTCEKIRKIYDDKLKALPENIRNMTLSEYMDAQKKAELKDTNNTDLRIISSEFAKSKLLSEKKTQKKIRSERKRSLSASVCSVRQAVPSKVLSRVLSESYVNTPCGKRSAVPANVITPKFNPRVPLSKDCMRKPRAGEVVLSISGSPLQNFVDDVALSLGGGKVINIEEESEAKLNNDFVKRMDEETKLALENVKKKLESILQS